MPDGLDRALYNDNAVSPDQFDLAKKDFCSSAVTAYERRRLVWDLVEKKQCMHRKSEEFIRTWKLDSETHLSGSEIVGQTLEKLPLTVALEDKEIVSYVRRPKLDQLIGHWNHAAVLGRETGIAIATAADRHCLQELAVGARTSGEGSFPGGQTLTTPRTGTLPADAYPISQTGSKRFQTDLGEILQKMKEDDVDPEAEFYCFIDHYMHRVLRQDDSLMSHDYVDGALADKITGKLLKVENCWLITTNNLPSANLSANAEGITIGGVAAYAANFTTTAGLIMGPQALATVVAGGIDPSIDWLPERRVWQIGAALLKGHKAFRLECCGEIAVAG